jgi:hypothetical protein
MSNKKFAKIVDLFSVGAECYLGDDETGKPIVVWISKPNAFEIEEANRDGQAGRLTYLLRYQDPESDESKYAKAELADMTNEVLVDTLVNSHFEEDQYMASYDVDADDEWRDTVDYMRREAGILDDMKDENTEDIKARREKLSQTQGKYIAAITDFTKKRQDNYRKDIQSYERDLLEKTFIDIYKNRTSVERYMLERNVTRLYYAMRECDAVMGEKGKFDHTACDHKVRMLEDRQDVRSLPEEVLDKTLNLLDDISIGQRDVANFQEDQSSSN